MTLNKGLICGYGQTGMKMYKTRILTEITYQETLVDEDP